MKTQKMHKKKRRKERKRKKKGILHHQIKKPHIIF